MATIKVMIVDDSAVVRQVIASILSADPGIEVIGAAADPLFAMNRMKAQWPDVIVLDIEMPRMDGLTFLRKLMNEHPTPVVICSSLAGGGTETSMQALAAGAVSVITKPKLGLKSFLENASADLIANVKAAAKANPRRLQAVVPMVRLEAGPEAAAGPSHAMAETTERIIAIGTSTGGTQALEVVLRALPRVAPGIVVVQHMPAAFTASFAGRLNGLCEVEVKEAANGDRVMPGRALIAPGGMHMMLRRSGAQYHVEVAAGPLVNRHCPSVDVLFRSVAKCAGRNAVGIIMTGMGDDGARGLLELHQAGGYAVAQDEESCVVFGMPKEAIKLGAVDRVIGLRAIPAEIMRHGGGWK